MRRKSYVINFALLLICALVLSACQPIKKKFVRKKKAADEDVVQPVLDPIDYAPIYTSDVGRYEQHYRLYLVWQKDLDEAFVRQERQKRLEYLTQQTVGELGKMRSFVGIEHADGLDAIIKKYNKFITDLDNPKSPAQLRSIQIKTNQLLREVKSDYHPDNIFESSQ